MATGNELKCVTCGDTSLLTGGRKRIIFPCAGVANVGQISNAAALQLTDEGYGAATCIALLGTGDAGLKKRIADADEVVIIDGCPVTCGGKIAAAQGVTPAQHIIITELGFEKAYTRNFTEDDVETVVSAAWEGKGR
ncbi:MAG: putative zinc-binding protein [Methanomicrobiales archaeon]|nr:putative zinc-binding protein [Methanomicrobiales archaeon]